MNIAIIFAGGTGQRMNSKTKPKQFLELHGKPIIVYTIEEFQRHELIDGIILVMLSDWVEYCEQLKEQYHLTKIKAIISGGDTAQKSTYIGIKKAKEIYGNGDIVLIHDGVRPLIDSDTISKNIECVKKCGSAVTVTLATETITIKNETGEVGQIIERSKCEMARAPQSFYLGDLYNSFKKAEKDNNLNFIDSASLMKFYGHKLSTVVGKPENIKITTPSDFYIFRAMIDARENSQIFG